MFIYYILYMYCYFYYVHPFLENSLIFSHYFFAEVFGITWTITYSKKLHSLKMSAESFWVILRIILVVFLYLLRAIKPLLIKVWKDVFCVIPMLTTLSPAAIPALLETILGIFWSVLWYFSVFLEKRLVSYEKRDNALMVVRLKNFMGHITLCLGLFWVFSGVGAFLYFLRKF